MSDQPSGTSETLSISPLDLGNPDLLDSSVNRACNDLLQILKSFAQMAADTPVESTHQLRKKLKFFRAFVKLLKPYHPAEQQKQVNVLLRDSGRNFSDLRDAHVRALMIEELLANVSPGDSKSQLTPLEEQNRLEIRRLESQLLEPQNRFLLVARELEQSELLKGYFNLSRPDPELVLETFRSSFQKSALAYQNAFESDDPDQMHEWRKRLKDVQYQFELILINLPDRFHQTGLSVELLCDHLGRYNDLDMLHQWLGGAAHNTPSGGTSNPGPPLRREIDALYPGTPLRREIDALYPVIKHLGRELYAGSPFET